MRKHPADHPRMARAAIGVSVGHRKIGVALTMSRGGLQASPVGAEFRLRGSVCDARSASGRTHLQRSEVRRRLECLR